MNEDITPINHTAGSAFAEKAKGTATGAIKGGVGTALLWIGGAVLLGVGIAALATGTGGLGLAGVGTGLARFIFSPLTIGGVLGGLAGLSTVGIPAGLGAIFGGFSGHAHASERVNSERGAAMEMQQAIAMQQAQMAGMGAPANKYDLPAQGAPMNPAGTKVSAMEYDGVAAGQQLQRA